MKKQDLLNLIDQELLDSLFGFCYHRTANSLEAEELCSDIMFAIIRAANSEGDIRDAYPFIWRIARNVYADHTKNKARNRDRLYMGDPEELFATLADEESKDQDRELLARIYRHIAFLTRAYREVMVAYYLDGRSVSEIAREQNASENAIRQRLFSARETIKKGVEIMEAKKPLSLQEIQFELIGTGSPASGDPREVCNRQLSNHIVWLCRNREVTAKEISETLNVPMMYVEEELDIQCKGVNGKYGLLKKTENGKYTTNFVLLDKNEIKELHGIYKHRISMIADAVAKYVTEHKEEYLSFPYLNKKVDFNLVLWQQFFNLSDRFEVAVGNALKETFFADIERSERPFSVFGYESNGNDIWGCGCDGIGAQNVCGYANVHLTNIYISRVKAHFHCAHNIANDSKLQMMLRAIEGLDVNSLSAGEKETAAKAVECGYVYRDGDMLYTKILMCDMKDKECIYTLNQGLCKDYQAEIDTVAGEIAAFIRQKLPAHLLSDYWFANMLAATPVYDLLADALIERGLLTPPENGIGAEGCWGFVEK